MKTLLICTALLITSALASADVVMNDNGTLTKNGASLNNAWDELLNGTVTNAEVAAAWKAKLADFQTRLAAKDQQLAEAIAEQIKALTKERDDAKSAEVKAKAEAEAAKQAAAAAETAADAKKKQIEDSYAELLAGAKAA